MTYYLSRLNERQEWASPFQTNTDDISLFVFFRFVLIKSALRKKGWHSQKGHEVISPAKQINFFQAVENLYRNLKENLLFCLFILFLGKFAKEFNAE